jgi:hypothetical protein
MGRTQVVVSGVPKQDERLQEQDGVGKTAFPARETAGRAGLAARKEGARVAGIDACAAPVEVHLKAGQWVAIRTSPGKIRTGSRMRQATPRENPEVGYMVSRDQWRRPLPSKL